LVRFTSALQCHPTLNELEILRLNRALANLRICSYDEALGDVRLIIDRDHPPEKALYRASQALYHLCRFQDCLQTLENLLREYPENEAAIRQKTRVQQRLVEEKTGQYNFQNMNTATQADPLSLDYATYVGPVKVKESGGRGRGLFTTKPVVAGELLLCEKAFSYCYEDRDDKAKDSLQTPLLANMLTNRITLGTQVSLMKEIIQKLKRNPSLLSSITSLHHGSYIPAEETYVDNNPIIDT
jgi:tetratricopeptide (TPR) repeat protein